MRIATAWLGALLALCGIAKGQSTEVDLAKRLTGKPLLLRGCWMDDKLKFDAAGKPEADYKIGPFTMAGFDLVKIAVSGDRLKLDGARVALTFDKDGTMDRRTIAKRANNSDPEKITIEIDGHGNKDFGKELDAIFAESPAELLPTLPDYWQKYVTTIFGSTDELLATPIPPVKPTNDPRTRVRDGIQPPKVLSHVDPEFSEVARRLRYSGNVLIDLKVDKDGTPSHVSIRRPAGAGLDEMAVLAVQQYRFSPAMKDGQPIVVELQINVNFTIRSSKP